MGTKVVGGESVLLEVTRVAGERGQGAAALYAFGYSDFAELIGDSPWAVAGAVVDGLLEPLSLIELALARQDGLASLRTTLTQPSLTGTAVKRLRPQVVTQTMRVKLTTNPRPYGLRDLWAIGYQDIAIQATVELQTAWNAQKLRSMDVTDLVSIVDYVVRKMPEQQAHQLGLRQER